MAAELAYLYDVLSCLGAGDTDDSASAPADTHYADLLARVRENDHAAFEELLIAMARPLEAYARRFTGSSDAAQDLVQDVFAHFWEQRTTLQVRGSVRAYFYTAVRNRALDVRRRDHAEAARWAVASEAGSPAGMGGGPSTAEADVERQEIAARVTAALNALPPRTREAALLRWADGLSRAEIAAIMGVAVATVKNQLTHATQIVRALLADLRDSA